ncbi:MAG: RDD family protein [Candidatus Brocadiaceae bacterium]|nr:RDD family protein [Candidatus Brocadiaceae bacterium]
MNTNDQFENEETNTQTEKKSISLISGFWRRIFAYIIDGIILGIFGLIIGTIFFDYFAELGGYGRIIGFIPALLYFGILNSSISNGQTVGKRILKIKVIGNNAQTLSPLQSIARFLIIGFPFFLNGAMIPPEIMLNTFISLFLLLIVFFMGGSIIYLYIFNRKSRQSLHDLVVGSYVVRTTSNHELSASPIWKGHLAVVGLIFVAVIVMSTTVLPKVSKAEFFSEILAVQESIQNTNLVHVVTVTSGKSFGTRTGTEEEKKWKTTFLSTNAILKKRPSDYDEIINNIASIILDNYLQIAEKDVLVVNVAYGYDIGISNSWIRQRKQLKPTEWQKLLSQKTGKTKENL